MTTDPIDRAGARRRALLKALAAAPLAASWSLPVLASEPAERSLSFYHTHTDERLRVVYFTAGDYVKPALDQVDRLLRDFRTGEVVPIDVPLLDTVHALVACCGGGTVEIISAYRSPQTNAMLRSRSGGVAEHSLHLEGRAVDIRLSGFPTARLRDAALALGRGGVGYYPRPDFLHLDTGRLRSWGPLAG